MKVLKQRNIPLLGAIVDSFVMSLPLLSIINFISMLAILWVTTIQPYAYLHIPWLTISMFIGFMVASVIIAMTVIYKYIIPAIIFTSRK